MMVILYDSDSEANHPARAYTKFIFGTRGTFLMEGWDFIPFFFLEELQDFNEQKNID